MVTIMGTLLGLIGFLTGSPWVSILFGIGAGLLSDLYLKSGEHKSVRRSQPGCGILPLRIVGMALPLFFGFRDACLESCRSGCGDAYVDALAGYTPNWMFRVMVTTIFVGGRKQRVAISCAAVSGDPILLFDEPTSGPDPGRMKQVAGILRSLKDEGRTVPVITHDTEPACLRDADLTLQIPFNQLHF